MMLRRNQFFQRNRPSPSRLEYHHRRVGYHHRHTVLHQMYQILPHRNQFFQRSHASLPVMIRVLMVATMPLRLCIFSQQLHRCRICRQPVIMSCMSVTLRTPHGRQEINAHAAAMRNQVALIRKMNVTMTQMTHALACHMSVTTLRGLTARLCVVSKQLSKSASECYAFNIHMGHDVYTAVRVCACNTSV